MVEESTVRTHVKRILSKLGLRDRIQAVIFAYETGIRPAWSAAVTFASGRGGTVGGTLEATRSDGRRDRG